MTERVLVIHAGTHKTASTYIQCRLHANRSNLSDNNVFLLSPDTRKLGRCYEFATELKRGRFAKIKRLLTSASLSAQSVVLSDERLAQPLTDPEVLARLVKVARRVGLRLKVVLFLRDQPDYMNSLYVQEVRRFYHCQSIDRYVARCLEKRSNRFDYNQMFDALLSNRNVEVAFLPFASGLGDPFDRLMQSQGWTSDQAWAPAPSATVNDQIGAKGVWLSRKVGRRLKQMGADRRLIRGQSRFVRQYANQYGWSEDRFYGLNPALVSDIRNHYRRSNNIFSQRVWGCDWEHLFPITTKQLNTFELRDLPQRKSRVELRGLVDAVVADVKREKPQAFPD